MSSNRLLKMAVFLESFYTFRLFLLEQFPAVKTLVLEREDQNFIQQKFTEHLPHGKPRVRLRREQRPPDLVHTVLWCPVWKWREEMSGEL